MKPSEPLLLASTSLVQRWPVPLQTAHGPWAVRESRRLTLVSATTGAEVAAAEVAPLPWDGQSLAAIDAWLGARSPTAPLPEADELRELPWPSLRFGLGCLADRRAGLASWLTDGREAPPLLASGLLPAGAGAVAEAERLLVGGVGTLKWKVGVHPIAVELPILAELLTMVGRHGARLRVDANGGLPGAEALDAWLAILVEHPARGALEYFEQPLPIGAEVEMAAAATRWAVPIALDESILGAATARHWLGAGGWRAGPLVLKPAVCGTPAEVAEVVALAQAAAVPVIFSTALELAEGFRDARQMAVGWGDPRRAHGFGVGHLYPADSRVHHWQPANRLLRKS